MNDSTLYIFEEGVGSEIPKGVVCTNARFVFDQAVRLTRKDYLQLRDGQWFLVSDGQATLLEGKWDR